MSDNAKPMASRLVKHDFHLSAIRGLVGVAMAFAGAPSASYSAEPSKEIGEVEIYLDGAQGVVSPLDKQPTEAEPAIHPDRSMRVFCVRACDGFYFPLDLPLDASRPSDADSACHGACPGAEVLTYYKDGNSDSIERAKSLRLDDYASLQHAYGYRSNLNAACQCHRPADLNASILTDPTLRRGDIVATSQGLVMFRGAANTNQLEKNFSPVKSASIPRQFEAEIREIDRQYPDRSASTIPVKIIAGANASPSDGIHFLAEATKPAADHDSRDDADR